LNRRVLQFFLIMWAVTLPAVAEVTRGRGTPVFSQDRYGEERIEAATPEYTQDQFAEPDIKVDLSETLRDVPERGREWSEVEIAKGIVQLNAKRFDSARDHFERALRKDERNFVAREYLAAISEAQGNYDAAVEQLARAKHIAPESRHGVLNFRIGFIYFRQGQVDRSRAYLLKALEQKAVATHAYYLLGQMSFREKNYVEAEKYFHESALLSRRFGARAAERELTQATYYYLGEVYARLGYFDSASTSLARAEPGESAEIRNAAWRTHSEVNQARWTAGAGLFGQYDSNVLVLPVDALLPDEISSQSGNSAVFTAFGDWTSPRYREWSVNAGTEFYWKTHLDSALRAYDVLNFHFDGGVSRYSGEDWRVDAKYSFDRTLADRLDWYTYQTTHGPDLSVQFTPHQRWKWTAGFFYLISKFGRDPLAGIEQRSGRTTGVYLKAAIDAPNPRLLPNFKYQFEHVAARGLNYRSDVHSLLAGVDWRWFERTRMHASVGVSMLVFPGHAGDRSDILRTGTIGVLHWFEPHLAGLIDVSVRQNDSNAAGLDYNRAAVTVGMTYRL